MYRNLVVVTCCFFPSVGGYLNKKLLYIHDYTVEEDWTKKLKKPSWVPPDWINPPIWAALYVCMGYASYIVYRENGFDMCGQATLPLMLYCTQLGLNWAWPNLYFVQRDLHLSFIDLTLLTVNVAICIIAFYQIDCLAGCLMVPYFAWLLLSLAINYRIYIDNPGEGNETPPLKRKKQNEPKVKVS